VKKCSWNTGENRDVAKKNIFQTIKNKEMDRKEFLKYSGLTLAAVVGFRGIISLISENSSNKVINNTPKESSRGFGGGKYGA
jgi:hypothetical protein